MVVLWLLYPYRIITLCSNKYNGDDAAWSCQLCAGLWFVVSQVEKYQGQKTDKVLKVFVVQKLGSSDSLSAEGATVPETSSPVIFYSGDNFEHGIANGISLIKFFAPW